MTSDQQAEANRRNAQRSTGPRTPEGKAVVRLNAMRHGLLSQQPLLPDEDRAEFQEFAERLRASLAPVGELEELLAEQVVMAAWRLRRVLRIEVELFERTPDEELFDSVTQLTAGPVTTGPGQMFKRDSTHTNAFSKLSRYEAGIERAMYRALHELQRLQLARQSGQLAAPIAVDLNVSVAADGDGSDGFVSQ